MQERLPMRYLDFWIKLPALIFTVVGLFAAGYDRPIANATQYLRTNLKHLDLGTMLSALIVVRRYDVRISQKELLDRISGFPAKRTRIWLSEFDSASRVSELELRTLQGIPWLLVTAQHCDIYPLPWDFIPRLREVRRRGGVGITRSLYAIQVIQDKKCPHDETAYVREKSELLRELPEVMQVNPVGSELWTECLLALYLTNHRDWVTKDMLRLLVDSQSRNGSWNDSYPATLKALWVLLEEERQSYLLRMPRS